MESFLREHFRKGVIWLAVFIVFTLLVKVIDVKAIGPEETKVGFAALNGFVFKTIGQHEFFEKLTKILGYIALLAAAGFAAVGVLQFLKTKSLKEVDGEIIILGVFYVVVMLAYVFFELCVVNYRPVILDEGIEASYPSSHTVLVICIFATTPGMIYRLTMNKSLYTASKYACYAVIAVMVIGRLISGVHWFTDIIGGILLSAALVYFFNGAMEYFGAEPLPDAGAKKKLFKLPINLPDLPVKLPTLSAGGHSASAGSRSTSEGSHTAPESGNTATKGSHAAPETDSPAPAPRRNTGKGGSHLAK